MQRLLDTVQSEEAASSGAEKKGEPALKVKSPGFDGKASKTDGGELARTIELPKTFQCCWMP